MNNMNWLIRASRWVKDPPSMGRVKLVLAIIVIALIVVGLQKFGLWPDWATMERNRGPILPR